MAPSPTEVSQSTLLQSDTPASSTAAKTMGETTNSNEAEIFSSDFSTTGPNLQALLDGIDKLSVIPLNEETDGFEVLKNRIENCDDPKSPDFLGVLVAIKRVGNANMIGDTIHNNLEDSIHIIVEIHI
jgi:hypothetical protein